MKRRAIVDHTRILVCGGCEFTDLRYLAEKLNALHAESPVGLVIEGDAVGADENAGRWANYMGIPLAVVTPQWRTYGKDAWWRRNESMLLLQPTRVIAFPGGGGTAHMVACSRKAKVPVLVISAKQYTRETGNVYPKPSVQPVA